MISNLIPWPRPGCSDLCPLQWSPLSEWLSCNWVAHCWRPLLSMVYDHASLDKFTMPEWCHSFPQLVSDFETGYSSSYCCITRLPFDRFLSMLCRAISVLRLYVSQTLEGTCQGWRESSGFVTHLTCILTSSTIKIVTNEKNGSSEILSANFHWFDWALCVPQEDIFTHTCNAGTRYNELVYTIHAFN